MGSRNYVPRVVQLDALSLDAEFYSLIKNQVLNLCSLLKIDAWSHKYEAEIKLLVKFVIWKLSISRTGASIGQSILGVKYPRTGDNKILKLLIFLEALIPYLHQRCFSTFRDNSNFKKIEKPLKYIGDGAKALEIVNFCVFLMQNRYPTLVNRLLKLQMIPAKDSVQPIVAYSYQLREMLWHQFADFLMIILPLINIHRIKRYLKDWGFNKPSGTSPSTVNLLNKCCVCNDTAVIPQRMDNCIFCYYCLKANSMTDPDFKSLACTHK